MNETPDPSAIVEAQAEVPDASLERKLEPEKLMIQDFFKSLLGRRVRIITNGGGDLEAVLAVIGPQFFVVELLDMRRKLFMLHAVTSIEELDHR